MIPDLKQCISGGFRPTGGGVRSCPVSGGSGGGGAPAGRPGGRRRCSQPDPAAGAAAGGDARLPAAAAAADGLPLTLATRPGETRHVRRSVSCRDTSETMAGVFVLARLIFVVKRDTAVRFRPIRYVPSH